MVIAANGQDIANTPLDQRVCTGTTFNNGAPFIRARMRMPASGWALGKFPGVKTWVNEKKKNFESPNIIIERSEPVPNLNVYDV